MADAGSTNTNDVNPDQWLTDPATFWASLQIKDRIEWQYQYEYGAMSKSLRDGYISVEGSEGG